MSLAVVTATATVRDDADALTDTTTITLRVRKDDEDWTSQTSITHSSTGVYTKDVTINEAGRYTFEWYAQIASGLERTAVSNIVIT